MRLLTRADLDGLTCATLLSLHEEVDNVMLIRPQDITDGLIAVEGEDILANVPYHTACAMWFDHHAHTATPVAPPREFKGAYGAAPSAARLVYEYYGGEEALPQFAELVRETDRLDSANLTPEDVLDPQSYILLGFTVDSRSGLPNMEAYFLVLMDLLSRAMPIREILAYPEVARACQQLRGEYLQFRKALQAHSRIEGKVVVTDLRGVEPVPAGNRFLIYALYPQATVSVLLKRDPDGEHLMMKLGRSIFNRTSTADLGEIAARYGGGGHPGAGSLPLMDDPEQQIRMVLAELKGRS